MPALGADMETGKVVEWLVEPGDRVKPGDVVAVVETHKGAIDVECFLEGVIDELVALDVDLPVGAVLAHVRAPGEAARAEPVRPEPLRTVHPELVEGPKRSVHPEPQSVRPEPVEGPARREGERTNASPAARRRAHELGLNADTLHGTGVDGAVTLADVELAAKQPRAQPTQPTITTTPTAPRQRKAGFDPAQMRQAIAAAMGRSKREIPHYYLSTTIDFAAAQAWLDAWNAPRDPAERLLPAALLLAAVARSLVDVPQLNGFYENNTFRAGQGVHIGWAIALRGGGLVAPAIRDVDKRTLPDVMRALRDLVQRARTGGLRSSELTDPTITVTSLGDRGAESVLGVIYPPQVAIVGFGRVVVRPWIADAQVVPRPLVAATLAADHRASDGHVGGQLLAAIEQSLQDPEQLNRTRKAT